jgi:hypothetical protein
VYLLAVIHKPGEIPRSKSRIQEAVKARRPVEGRFTQDLFEANDPVAVLT